jgi:tryptophan halogenase
VPSAGEPLRRIVIVGGGTAGWMTAAAVARNLPARPIQIHLVESSEIGIVGVGEATIPPILAMNRMLDIDEDKFIAATQASFKLGIEFESWNAPGERYIHPFGQYGQQIGPLFFPHYWRRLRAEKPGEAGALDDYSLSILASHAGKFHRAVPVPDRGQEPMTYAFHFDAGLYAQFLRARAEAMGVVRHDRKILGHQMDERGFVTALELEGGEALEGDFFIDCSGFRGLLIEQALGSGYEEWTHWLPCDRALAVPSAPLPDFPPYTRATARSAGWQWRIPLQHRTGNGYVYCSRFISDDEAAAELLGNLPTEALADPRPLRFTTGRRKVFWNRNVLAIGLASGFLEPLESTSIHLIQTAIEKLIHLFPDRGFKQADIDYYNRVTAAEYEQVRDMLILHYWANGRDEPFWRERREVGVPDSLRQRIDLYRSYGRVFRAADELFSPVSWTAVMEGQGVHAEGVDPLTFGVPLDRLEPILREMRAGMARRVAGLPGHREFVADCVARASRG